jgi:hypothetical protein
MTPEPDRAFPPDAVIIRRTRWGWSAFDGDTITGGEDGLIASSDHVGPLAEYVLTLEPSEVVIQPGDASTAEWFAESRAAGCTGTGYDEENDTIEHKGELPCPVHPGL